MKHEMRVDLHSHILPCLDDGSKSVDESLRLLQMEKENGVSTVVCTPHFYHWKNSIKDFAQKRENAKSTLCGVIKEQGMNFSIKLGAEVYLYPEICDDKGLERLCISGTRYMLIELPFTFYYNWIPRILFKLQLLGITPIIAHVERYGYIKDNPQILYDMICSGAIAQVNAGGIAADMRRRGLIFGFMRNNLAHIVASDTHSVRHRPPRVADAFSLIEKKFGSEYAAYLDGNGEKILNNIPLETDEPVRTRRNFLHFSRCLF